MNDLQLLAKKVWLACAGLMLLLFIWDWYWLGVSEAGNQTRPDPLIAVDQVDTQQALNTLLEHNLWEPTRKSEADLVQAQQTAAESQKQSVSWQLVAVAAAGDKLTAFMGNPGDAASYKKYLEGDVLPNGEKILKILSDRVVYQTNQNPDESKSNGSTSSAPSTKELYLFGRKGE